MSTLKKAKDLLAACVDENGEADPLAIHTRDATEIYAVLRWLIGEAERSRAKPRTPSITPEQMANALQAAWDDFVGDTICFPDCFECDTENQTLWADFEQGNFARTVVGFLLAARES